MVKLLLDGTFPIHLAERLGQAGMSVERLIVVGRASEPYVTERLAREKDAVFVTEDPGCRTRALADRGTVIVSLDPRALPLQERVDLWTGALESFAAKRPPGRLFEIRENGQVIRVPLDPIG